MATAPITWDETGKRFFETGCDHGILFPTKLEGGYAAGVPWNGLSGVTESPSGAEATPVWADNMKYLNLISAEDFGATVTAYTYPDEFEVCNGFASPSAGLTIGQQGRAMFGLAYRTKVGNDVNGNLGHKIHIIWGCQASPSERAYTTVNDSPEALQFSWEISTTPVPIEGDGDYKPTAYMCIDSTKDPKGYAAVEKLLRGDGSSTASKLPTPREIIDAVSQANSIM